MDRSIPLSDTFCGLTRDELEVQITELAGQLNAANYRWLTLIAEFDRRNGWSDGCLPSCAHWLNFKVGLNLGAAREKLRVAHALPGLPRIAAAMARGELSYSKVRALTRVATEATEATLLMIAQHGTAHHVETVARYFRQARESEALSRDEQQQANRAVSFFYDEDGSLVVKARLPALSGQMLLKALEAALPEDADGDTYPARRADALGLIAESFLANASQGASGSADHHQVLVHVDIETLQAQAPGRCHIEHGPALPVATLRRLTCDASLVRITENADGVPLDVGRKTRSIPPAIRRALHSRDQGCCFPGCTHRRYVDAHHIEHWVDGGRTHLDNLVTLCRLHHRLVHEGGITVESLPGGGWRFVRADGRAFSPPRSHAPNDLDWSIEVEPNAAATRWRASASITSSQSGPCAARSRAPHKKFPRKRRRRRQLSPKARQMRNGLGAKLRLGLSK